MPGRAEGLTLREWRMSRRWGVSVMARELIRAAREAGVPLATGHRNLMHEINAWERGARPPSEQYRLLYLHVFGLDAGPGSNGSNGNGRGPGGGQAAALAAAGQACRDAETVTGTDIDALETRALATPAAGDSAEIRALAAVARDLQAQITALAARLAELSGEEEDR